MPFGRVIDAARLRTPREHLGVLIDPPLAGLVHAAESADAAVAPATMLGTPLGELRRRLRASLGVGRPLIVSGHQCEFFHAGIFAKTIATEALAASCGGESLFVAVDSDLPKATRLTVPQRAGDELEHGHVPIPGVEEGVPPELFAPQTAAAWRQFFAQVRKTAALAADTALDRLAEAWCGPDRDAVELCAARPSSPAAAQADAADLIDLCGGLLRGAAAVQRAIGLRGSPAIRLSRLAATPEFRVFMAEMMLRAADFAEAYNAAQADYRVRHHVRSPQRPVPPLALGPGRAELPLWAERLGTPRQRVSVAQDGGRFALLAGEHEIGRFDREQLADATFHDQAWPLSEGGWLLRPRALALSAFMRMILADVYITGVGGAHYDEITEQLVARLWGVDLPPLGCVSATLRMGHVFGADCDSAGRDGADLLRDARYNPQRHFAHLPPDLLSRREQLVAHSRQLRRENPGATAERRRVFRAIRDTNEALLAAAGDALLALERRAEQGRHTRKIRAVACEREYFFGLHSLATLRALAERIA